MTDFGQSLVKLMPEWLLKSQGAASLMVWELLLKLEEVKEQLL